LGSSLPVDSIDPRNSQNPRLHGDFDPSRQLQWLIDTPERLEQYRQLGDALGQHLRINIEIDVGLHRGGVADVATLERILALIAAHPERLELGGFMGYDPHVVKVPSWLRSRDSLFHEVVATYQGYVDYTRGHYPQLWNERITLNGAGSPTYRLYEHVDLLNDLSVGSAMVKPTDFDLDTLADHVPALFIATPGPGSARLVAFAQRVARLLRALPSAPMYSKALAGVTRREHGVLSYVADGYTNKQIARALGCSESTVKFHLRNLFRKLKVSSRTALCEAVERRGIHT